MRKVIVWGATGQAKVVREALGDSATIIAVFDNRAVDAPFPDVPIFHGDAGFDEWMSMGRGEGEVFACVAIGGDRGRDRLDRVRILAAAGFPPITVVHPRAFVAADAHFGDGCQILAMAAVGTCARLGDSVIVNTSASIDHDCVVGNGAHVGPGATLAGEVVVGEFAFIGAGATILPRIRIGSGATVGAGAVVTKDVADGATVVGNPAAPLG